MEKKMETTILGLYWGYRGIMEKKMETTILGLYWGYRGIMEKKYYILSHEPAAGTLTASASPN